MSRSKQKPKKRAASTTETASQKDSKTGRFLPGNSGFGGRPKGARNKLSTEFFDDLYETWQEHGASAFKMMAIDAPKDFVKVAASLMPKEFEIKKPLEEISDADLQDIAAALLAYSNAEREAEGDDALSGSAGADPQGEPH